MPTMKSEFACPICQKHTGALNQIYANAGELVCSANGAHKWNDTMAFMNENPVMCFKPVMAKALPQDNYSPMTISVPLHLKQAAEQKFGDKLSSTVVSLLVQLVQGDVMVIPESDVERLKQHLGQRPQNSSELVGMVWAMIQQVDEAKAERDEAVRDLKAYEGMSTGRVVVDLGDQYQTAIAVARDRELPLKLFCERALIAGLEGSWF